MTRRSVEELGSGHGCGEEAATGVANLGTERAQGQLAVVLATMLLDALSSTGS